MWTVIIPVKPAATGKSRLALGPELARAIAQDTVAAVVACETVERVIVVTADEGFRPAGVDIVVEAEPAGIDAAIRSAAALAGNGSRAALLGDLPALRPVDLAAALTLARRHSRAFVADHERVGTTLVTAVADLPLITGFGVDSAARHLELGLAQLELTADSTVTMDVDTGEQLDRARGFGLGAATTSALAALST